MSARSLALAVLLPLAAGEARADGAFPDSFAPLLPRTRPDEILLATNFGLFASADDGATWTWSCEVPETSQGRLYNLGAAPDERIYAVGARGVVATADGGCHWIVGGGALAGGVALDAFPDPRDGARVLAIGVPAGARDAAVFESRDAGATFAGPLFAAPAGAVTTGVELAASTAGSIYVSFYETPGIHPRLARSTDDGASWTTLDLEPVLGAAVPFLAAVDPADAAVVYLRVSGRRANEDAFEELAITRDAGLTWATPLTLPGGTLTTFFRRAGGDVLVTGTLAGVPIARRSADGGATFAPWPLAIHPRGFAERDGLLFAATDGVADGFALASSPDGDAWTPVMRYQDATAVNACIRATCDTDCRYRAGLGLFRPAICGAPAADSTSDAAAPAMTARPAAAAPSGCACQVPGPGASGSLAAWLLFSVAALLRRARRRGPVTPPSS